MRSPHDLVRSMEIMALVKWHEDKQTFENYNMEWSVAMHTILTSKGQITLPKDLREKLCLSAGDRIEFVVEDDRSVRLIAKQIPVSRLKGMLPRPNKPVSLEEMDRAIQAGGRKS